MVRRWFRFPGGDHLFRFMGHTPWKTIPWTLKTTGVVEENPGGQDVRVYVSFWECNDF